MIRDVDWSPRARRDLLDIYEFIALRRHERDAARRLIRAVRRKAGAYARRPGLGTLHDEIELPGSLGPLRSFRVKNYLAFYVESPGGIAVLRVVHGGRDLPSLFRG